MEEYGKEKFYNKDWFLWLSLILFAPLGIFLLWKRKRYGIVSRVVVTAIFALLFFVPFGITGQGTTRENAYGQTEFSRVSWVNQSFFNFGNWFRNWRIRLLPTRIPQPTTPVTPESPLPTPLVTPLPDTQITQPTPIVTIPPVVEPSTPEQTPTPTGQDTGPVVNPTQTPATQPVGSDWKALQDKIFELTNVERQKNGVALFTYNASVEGYAVAKSQDMAVNNYFDHNSPTNGYFSDIWRRDGFKFSSGAENLYMMSDSRGFASRDVNSLAQSIVTGWMNSEGHRKNILNPNLKELGVGVAEMNNRLYATQLFRTP